MVTQHLVVDGLATYVPAAHQVAAFYTTSLTANDPQLTAQVAAMLPLLKPQALATLTTPVALAVGYASVAKTYITTTNDHTIAPSVQRAMYSRWPEINVITLASDHSPLLTATRQLTAILAALAQ